MPLRLILSSCALMFVFAAVPATASGPLPGERIAKGITAAGIDVSGLTVDEAAAKLEAVYGPRLQEGVIVQRADLTFRMTSAGTKVVFDSQTSAKRALYRGREMQQPLATPGAVPSGSDIPLAVSHDQAAVRRFTARIDSKIGRPARDAQLRITPRRVRVTHSKTGRDINAEQLAKDIGASLHDPRLPRVFKPALLTVKPKLTADVLRNKTSTVLTIDRSTFTLRLFKRLKVVKRYKVAVGQSAYPTPRGRFSIVNKQVNPTWSVPNSPWAGELAGSTVVGGSAANPLKARWMGIANGVGIHGTGEDYSIGTRASHGCIRMHVGDVIALYKRVPVGTPVLIA